MRNSAHLFILPLSVFLISQALFAATPPHMINFQGRLLDGTNLVNGHVSMELRVYTNAISGAYLYADSNQVLVVDGLYSTYLGDNTISGTLTNALTARDAYIEVVVNGTTLTPRDRITSVAYAIHAGRSVLAEINRNLILSNSFVTTSNALALQGQQAAISANTTGKVDRAGDVMRFPDGSQQTTAVDPLPVGTLLPFAGDFAPPGYMLCDGRAVSRTTFAFLFSVIGTHYGPGDGAATFNLPDMRGRTVIGLDNLGGVSADRVQAPFADTAGGSGGEEKHLLTSDELPAHSHGVNDPGHRHTYTRKTGSIGSNGGGTSAVRTFNENATSSSSGTGITVNNTGGDAAHNVMQPSMAMAWIIKTVAPKALNTPPAVMAGPDQLVALTSMPVVLSGAFLDDGLPNPPGTTSSHWTRISGPGTVAFNDVAAAATTASFSTNGVYRVQLAADDGYYTIVDAVEIVVNAPPVVDAGTHQLTRTLSATLDGTIQDDGLPSPPAAVTSLWSKISGPGNVVFGQAASPDTGVSFSSAGSYVLQLWADDGFQSAMDTVTVDVAVAPTVNAGPDENVAFLAHVLDGTISDDGLPSPPGVTTSIWQKVSGPGSVAFGNTAAVDTSVTFSTNGFYILRLFADDSQSATSDDVSLAVYTAAVPAQVTVDFTAMGSFTTAVLSNNNVTVTGTTSPGVPATLNLLHLNGLGVVGGTSGNSIDSTEGVRFVFDQGAMVGISYNVSSAGNLNGNGTGGDGFIEAFDGSGVSLGSIPVSGGGTHDVSALFSSQPIGRVEIRSDGDTQRISSLTYRVAP